MPHGTANCSLHKRPMLAVTGVVTETDTRLTRQPKTKI